MSGFPFKDRENFVDFALTKVLQRTTREWTKFEDAREEQSFLLKSFVSPRPHFRRFRGFITNPLETMPFFLFLFFTSQSLQEIASQLASLVKSERAHDKFALRCSSAIYADDKRVALE